MAESASTGHGANKQEALKGLHSDVFAAHMHPFWATTKDVAHDEVAQLLSPQKAVPWVWKYADIGPLLKRAAELVTMEDSDRRSLVMVNPGLAPRRASVTTMYTAYRFNGVDEIMPPHKHSASACRFGLEGGGNFTSVEGENVVFGPGDLILTANDAWHNFGSIGNEGALNLSVLDFPLVEMLHALEFHHNYTEIENGKEVEKKEQSARYPADYSKLVYGQGGLLPRFVDHHRAGGNASPQVVYRWEAMEAVLDAHMDHDGDPHDGIIVDYVNPRTGGPVFETISFYIQMLRPGEKTEPKRETASLLLAPFKGSGYSIIDGERFDWTEFDTIAIPGGCWVEHVNGSQTEPTILFGGTDAPVQKKLQLYKCWGRKSEGDLLRLL